MKFLKKSKRLIIPFLLILFSVLLVVKYSTAQDSLGTKMSGRILLQVEDRGQAWYINPENEKKYYLGTPEESFSLFKQLGFFMDSKILNKYLAGPFPNNYSGRVIINAQEAYEAYYINPLDLKALPLNSPLDAFNIMKNLSLGASNNDLKLIKTYNYLDNDIFSNKIIASSFDIEVKAFEPLKMKEFTRVIELSAEVINPQNRRILEKGLVWDYVTIPDLSINPTLGDNFKKVLSGDNSNIFSVSIADLVPGSYPFFRFYVVTDDGETIYSDIKTIQGEKSVSLPLIPASSSGTSGAGSPSSPIFTKFILNYGAGEGGSIEGDPLQFVTKGSSGESVKAKAAPGYKFVRWSDGPINNVRKDSPVSSDVIVEAVFETVCESSFVDHYDYIGGRFLNTYNTVAIGEQCWLKENMKTATKGQLFLATLSYDNNSENRNIYGALIFGEANFNGQSSNSNPSGIQGVCPSGWHVPSKSEWEQLLGWISGDGGIEPGFEGRALKANSDLWTLNTGTDNFGFSALPGGKFSNDRYPRAGYFTGLNFSANFWTSTAGTEPETSFTFNLNSNSDEAFFSENAIIGGLSIRCVQD